MHSTAGARGSRILLLVLVPSAVVCLVGGGLLVLERQGFVTLRRVPSVWLKGPWSEGNRGGIAIINTDVTSGMFVLHYEDALFKTARDEPLWIRARSITLRSFPASEGPLHLELRQGRGANRAVPDDYALSESGLIFGGEQPRIVARGTRTPLEWAETEGDPPRPRPSRFYIRRRRGVSVVESSGVTFLGHDEHDFWSALGNWIESISLYRWNGSAPVLVDIDDTTPAPDFFTIWGDIVQDNGGFRLDGRAFKPLWVYASDMTLVDERSSEPSQRGGIAAIKSGQ